MKAEPLKFEKGGGHMRSDLVPSMCRCEACLSENVAYIWTRPEYRDSPGHKSGDDRVSEEAALGSAVTPLLAADGD